MKLFFTFLSIGLTFFGYSQNRISGYLTDKNNNKIQRANISMPDLHKDTQTDINGFFEIRNVPIGAHTIVFSFIGFETQSKNIDLKTQPTVNITMVESVHQMDAIIVSTAFNKLQSENVVKIEHASVKEMQQRGATTLIEGLATIPGVSQISTGVSIGKPVIRGLSANRVLIYSQGVRLENQAFGDEHGLGLNDDGIESVEVIKGPASLLYGSDALGGVLYFNPEKYAKANTFSTDLNFKSFSNTNGNKIGAGFKGAGEKLKFLARFSSAQHADYQTGNNERVTNTRFNELDFKTGLGYSDKNFSSDFRYNYNQLKVGIPENSIAEQTTNNTPDYPRQAVFNHLLSLNNTFYLGTSKLDANIGYIFNDRAEFPENETPGSNWYLKTLNYDVKYHLPKFGELETIIGVQGMNQTNTNVGTEFLIPNASTNDLGFFGTARYDWNKNVIQAGIRYDSRKIRTDQFAEIGDDGYLAPIDRKFNSFNASLGYKTNLNEQTIFRLNGATGFRAPNIFELSSNGVHDGTIRYEIGNAALKSEQNFQADVNLEYKNTHFELYVNGFYNKINNYIYISPTGNVINGFNVYDYLQSDANLYGGEAGIHFHPHPIDWLHINLNYERVTGKSKNGDYLPLIPANRFNNTLRVDIKSLKWFKDGFASATVEHTLKQNNPSEFETNTNDYTLVNFGLGGQIIVGKTNFGLSLNANNVFNRVYVAHLSRLKADGIPNIGRNIVLAINVKI